MGIVLSPPIDGLRLTITLQPKDAANPLLVEQADCRDIFDAVRELEGPTGRRFRDRLHESAAANLLRLNPVTGHMDE